MDGDYIPGQRRPGLFSVMFVSMLTSSVVSVLTVGFLLRYGASLGPIAMPLQPTSPAHESEPQVARVPEVVNMSAEAADELLSARKLRLVVKERRPDPSVAAGSVIEQTPLAQSRIAPGGEVAVVLSTGIARSQVPDLSGQPLDKARAALEAAGFRAGKVAESDAPGEPGTVAATAPAAGTALDQGTEVAIMLAHGAIEVPRLVGQNIKKARELLTKAGLNLGQQSEIYDEHRRGNIVLSQEPEPGTRVASGAKVNLVVNQGD